VAETVKLTLRRKGELKHHVLEIIIAIPDEFIEFHCLLMLYPFIDRHIEFLTEFRAQVLRMKHDTAFPINVMLLPVLC
jgi:hypothetical protein